ncbi:RNase A-like domain-containing protein [Kitasatospora sp. NPDC004723]|uniref:RNase A-like domain-containing protein n=1 Tax=Kitasatospora sp. NPDC004723 TaxID=3154288 RepID=UPI0033A0954A
MADEGINGAHTLNDHVGLSAQKIEEKIDKSGIASVRNDQATASRPVAEAFRQWLDRSPKNATKLARWVSEQLQKRSFDPTVDLFPIDWELRGEGPFGTPCTRVAGTTQGIATGNKVMIGLKYARKHGKDPSRNFVVYTAYP